MRWSPHGRFIMLGGFGNLPGDMEFFDKKADGKCKLMGSVRVPMTVGCAWAPDGRHVVTSIVSPRMRVDNCFKVFKYNAELVLQQDFPVLYHVMWRPAPEGRFPDRPMSPGASRAGKAGAGNGAGGYGGQGASGYVPPHMRGKGGAKTNFSLAYDASEAAPGKVKDVIAQVGLEVARCPSLHGKGFSRQAAHRPTSSARPLDRRRQGGD